MAHNLTITGAMLSLLVASGLPALADDASTAPAAVLKAPVASSEPSAVQLRLTYTGEAWDTYGGIKTGGDYMHGADVSLSVDANKLVGWTGASFYAEGFYVTGKSLEYNNVGAFAAPSALDVYTDNMYRLYQLFYDQRIYKTDILLGIYDLQTQFAHTQPTELFLSRAYGLTTPLFLTGFSTGFYGPSTYPNTTVGTRIKQEINDQWTVKLGLLNGLANNPAAPAANDIIINSKTGVLAIGEVDYTPFAKTKLMAGYWGYTGKFTGFELNPNYTQHQSYGTGGGYVGGATRIYTIEGSRAVDAFINVGAGASAHSAADRSLNAGLTVTGLYAGRPQDKLGFAFNVLHVSTPFRDLLTLQGAKLSQYEGAFELTYRATINDWLVVQPDVQYIINPVIADIGKTGKNAFVFGLHFELSKLFDLL